jgi:tRNA A37 methylthiotransferase MiaB
MISKLPSTCTAATFSIQAGNGLTDPPGEKKIQDLRTEVVENFCEKSVGHAVRVLVVGNADAGQTVGPVREQGCQMVHLKTKNSNLGKFWRASILKI